MFFIKLEHFINFALMENLSFNKVLISGGNSFVANNFVAYLHKNTKATIIVCSRRKIEFPIKSINIIYEIADLLNEESYERIFKIHKPNQVFHLAAITRLSPGEQNPELTIQTNYFGSKLIADLCIKYKVETFLSVSSNLARKPKSVVGLSKYFSEVYLRNIENQNTKIISLRLPNIPDSPGSVTLLFKKQIENGGPVTITHPDMERRFASINEAADLLISALKIGENSNVIVITKENTRITDLAEEMIKRSGKEIEIKYIGIKKGEKLIEEKYGENEIIKTKRENISILKNDLGEKNTNEAFAVLKSKNNSKSFQLLIDKLKLSLHLEKAIKK